MQEEVRVERVDTKETRNGNTRFVLRDDQGREFSTFRPRIGEDAKRAQGRRARISYHEEERNGFTNVYLDGIEPLADDATASTGDDSDVEEAAWRTAIEAAPWLVDKTTQSRSVEPEEMFDKLKPFQELVADDIRDGDEDDD
jgi:hypothetical protein